MRIGEWRGRGARRHEGAEADSPGFACKRSLATMSICLRLFSRTGFVRTLDAPRKQNPISTLRLEAGKAETRIDYLYALINPSLQILLLVRQQSVAYNMHMGVSTRPARIQETHR